MTSELLSNDMTSDILIYNILKQSDDEFISKCNLKFIDRSVPAEEDDTIYIATVDLETLRETFNSVEYKALVNIYVKTKDTDYLEGSRSLRTTVKHIKKVLRGNVDCKQRRITFRNTTYEYGSKYTLKGMHLLVQMVEFENLREDDEKESCINLDVDVDVK
jgi:hypothetical protein